MPATEVVSLFGLRKVSLAKLVTTAGTAPTWIQIPSVESAAFKGDVGTVEQWGDDILQGVFYHSQKGSIVIKGNKLASKIIELLTGVTADITTTPGVEKHYIMSNKELFPPIVLVKAEVPYRDDNTGLPGSSTMYWFKCSTAKVWEAAGNERAKLGEQTIMLDSFASGVDETKTALIGGVDTAFGRLEIGTATGP